MQEFGNSEHNLKETKVATPVPSKKRKAKVPIYVSPEVQFDPKDCGPVSLSLLDWRRRQEWAQNEERKRHPHSRNLKNSDRGFMGLVDTYPIGIDASMVSWESINQSAEEDSNQSPTMEPPRKRHSSSTYGRWCSQLLNCLQGRGRIFARHEFFYSDIDKAW